MRLIECVPNFSEGRDTAVIGKIADLFSNFPGVKLLNVDPGYAANRTVYTYVGSPEAVSEATFRAFGLAADLIDMRRHTGTHPRIGAVDVCPFVPVSEVALEECAISARALSKRVGEELGIPVYCYEASAYSPERMNLASCRSGEYEGLPEKIVRPEWRPDFGPAGFNERVAKSGLSVIGARKYLVAINFNLANRLKDNASPTRDELTAVARQIAADVRESGRVVNGIRRGGPLKKCKAIGWYIDEYGRAQVSMNVTDIDVTPVHIVYETVCEAAVKWGAKITGSELIGLVPERVLAEAGRFYADKENLSELSGRDLISLAVKKLTLDDIRNFDVQSRVIEYLL